MAVTPSFCVIKQYYDSNYQGMAVSNTMVIYRGISTLETTGMVWNFYLVKYHKIANNSTTAYAREKISTDLGILRNLDFLYVRLNLLTLKFYSIK